MQTRWTRDAVKELGAIPQAKRDAILKAVAAYASNPFGQHPNAKPLKGRRDLVRLRIGDWRVIVARMDDAIEVRTVAHRREVYR